MTNDCASLWSMFRLIALGIFAIPICAQNVANPYDLARSISTHEDIDWPALWKTLGVTNPPYPPNCGACSPEVITMFDPSQVILAVPTPPEPLYFRFLQDASGWRFAGLQHAIIKNHGERHEIGDVGKKRFLRTSRQGASGSDMDSEIETWFDLSRPDFESAFEFTVQGVDSRLGSGVTREVRASVSGSRPAGRNYLTGTDDPDETIDLDVEVRYSGSGVDLGFGEYWATYARAPNQKKFSLREVRPSRRDVPAISKSDFDDLANINGGPSNEQLLVYALPRLKNLASGSDADNKEWLRSILSRCKDTPEKRTLQALLGDKQ